MSVCKVPVNVIVLTYYFTTLLHVVASSSVRLLLRYPSLFSTVLIMFLSDIIFLDLSYLEIF